MRRFLRILLVLALAAPVIPVLTSAQTSGHLPDDSDKAGCIVPPATPENMPSIPIAPFTRRYATVIKTVKPVGTQITLDTTGAGPVATACGDAGVQVVENACEQGQPITDRILRDICAEGVDRGFTVTTPNGVCSDTTAFVGAVAQCGCCTVTAAPPAPWVVEVDDVVAPLCLFDAYRDVAAPYGYEVTDADGGCRKAAHFQATTGANMVAMDLLPNYVLQVKPANATVQVAVFHTQGGTNPRTFSVPTTAAQSEATVAANITAGFNTTGLGLNATTVDSARLVAKTNKGALAANKEGDVFRDFPVTFIQGLPGKGVTDIRVTGGDQQWVLQESNDPSVDVPTLSTWGVILVVGLLLLSGYWLLQRRRRTVQVS